MLTRALTIVAMLVASLATPVTASASSHLEVVFLAGGQWDAALYRAPCGEIGLVDAGAGSEDEILAQLDAWDARAQLRWANVSHYDADHVGDVADIGRATGVSLSAVYDRGGGRDVKDTVTYRDYYDWVQPIRQSVAIGDRWTLCTGEHTVTFTVTSVGTDGTAAGGVPVTEENDRGVCVAVAYKQFDVASCGDVNGTDEGSRADVETAVAPAYGDVEVAKVNHHGSAFSSNLTYVDTLSPEASIVMVGNNSYGHPAPAVIDRWAAISDVFQTLNGDGTVRDGHVTVTSNGDTTFAVTTSASDRSTSYAVDEAQNSETPAARPTDESCPPDRVPDAAFRDTAGNAHEAAIDCVVWWEVANGTSPDTYAPGNPVNRAQMASFIARLITNGGGTLPEATRDHFTDDNGSAHEPNINRLAEAGIVGGVGGGEYRPDGIVIRDQMATFLVRAYEHVVDATIQGSRDWFDDDDDNTHEANINKSAEAGFTGGTATGGYNPRGAVSRAQIASFLARVLDLLVETGNATLPQDDSTGGGGGEEPQPEPGAAELTVTRVLADPDGDDVAHDAGEYVEIRNDGTVTLDLTGWYFIDEANHRLDWCAIAVGPGATARLYTGTGTDGSDHCHAGRGSAVWNNTGDTARLYAPDGTLVDSHNY